MKLQLAAILVLITTACSSGLATNVRPYLMTGNWYPSNPEVLRKKINTYLENNIRASDKTIKGMVLPHAGLDYSGTCAGKAWSRINGNTSINTVIILGVAHRSNFKGACLSDYNAYSTPLGQTKINRRIVDNLKNNKLFSLDNRIMTYEHSIENQLPFIQVCLKNPNLSIVPILFGNISASEFESFAELISPYVTSETLIIASSDFTHYGSNFAYTPFKTDIKENLKKLDMSIILPIVNLNSDKYIHTYNKTGITMCGFRPVGVFMKLMEYLNNRGELVMYTTSSEVSSSGYDHCVSYGSIIFTQETNPEFDETDKCLFLKLARETLMCHFQGEQPQLMPTLLNNKKYQSKKNLFVTLRKNGHLRGCIGSIKYGEPLLKGIQIYSMKAAFEDPRFKALSKNELKDIDIEISIMTQPQPISNYREIKLGTDGVILKNGWHQAVYLPQVALETGWNLETLLSRLSSKAGLDKKAYKNSETSFLTFQAVVFSEKELSCY